MKILFDENVPRNLKNDLSEFCIYTVTEMNWNGKKNGVLLRAMLKEGFDVFITGDKNIEYQQNFEKYPIPVIILNTHFQIYSDVKPLVCEIKTTLQSKLKKGIIKIPKT